MLCHGYAALHLLVFLLAEMHIFYIAELFPLNAVELEVSASQHYRSRSARCERRFLAGAPHNFLNLLAVENA